LKNNLKIKKPFSKMPKGWKLSGSPLLETFGTFKEDIAIENILLIS